MCRMKTKPGPHVLVLTHFVLQKVYGNKQPVSETDVSETEESKIEFPDEPKQITKQKISDRMKKKQK